MRTWLTTSSIVMLFLFTAFQGPMESTMAEELKEGSDAPQFELKGSDGKTYKSSELKEEGKVVVIAWFPKVFTGG